MSKIDKFYRDGFIEFNVNYEPLLNIPIICVNKGLWYKFNIDEIEKLEDETYNVISTTLLSIDDKLI